MNCLTEPGDRHWLATRPGPARLDRHAVVCLSRPEDGPAPFHRWPAVVHDPADPEPVRLYPARYPGDRYPLWWHEHPTIVEQAQDLAAELCDRSAARITLFGHGSSALVAYEAAVELLRIGAGTMDRLIVSACPAPTRAGADAPMPSEDEILERALVSCIESGSNPLPTQVETTARSLRAQAAALRSYHPVKAAVVDAPIWVLRWQPDHAAGPAASAYAYPAADCVEDTMSGWADCGPARFFDLDGPPARFLKAPDELLRILADVHPGQEPFA